MPPTGKPNNRETTALLEAGAQRLSTGLTLKNADGEKEISIQLLLETQKEVLFAVIGRFTFLHLW
jgi:hypothetical protein